MRPALKEMGMWSTEAEELILGTFAQESHLGYWLAQKNGPALGIGQMEPLTHDDCWRYLNIRNDIRETVGSVTGYAVQPVHETLVWDLRYAAVMSRLRYWMIPESIPEGLDGQAEYWKNYYNTELGKGTVDEYIENFNRFLR